MKQSVRITSFGSKLFEDAVQSASKLANFISTDIGGEPSSDWVPARFQKWSALEFSNRYFVHQNSEGDMERAEFGSLIDPDGVLSAIAGEEWVHTEDNQVKFFSRVEDTVGKMSFEEFDPRKFKMGDIVEVQFSIMAFARRGLDAGNNVRLVLRALTLLDDKHAKSARLKRGEVCSPTPKTPLTPSKSLKRAIGYVLDEEQEDDPVNTKRMRELVLVDSQMDAAT
ncbi:hypothetical protein HWV62_11940 [Athelia sp. TMB]|nr:hypothetical protein HWV62_11940 [Athelia sp. TMB]